MAGWRVWGGLGEVNKGIEGESFLGLCWEETDQSKFWTWISVEWFECKRRLFGRGLCAIQERWMGAGEGVFCSPLSWFPSSPPILNTFLRSRSAATKTRTTALTGQSPSPAPGRRGDGDAPSREPSNTNTGHPSSPDLSTKRSTSPYEDKDKDKKEVCSQVNLGCSLSYRVMDLGEVKERRTCEKFRFLVFYIPQLLSFLLQMQILYDCGFQTSLDIGFTSLSCLRIYIDKTQKKVCLNYS